jgi:hypothetical protein
MNFLFLVLHAVVVVAAVAAVEIAVVEIAVVIGTGIVVIVAVVDFRFITRQLSHAGTLLKTYQTIISKRQMIKNISFSFLLCYVLRLVFFVILA